MRVTVTARNVETGGMKDAGRRGRRLLRASRPAYEAIPFEWKASSLAVDRSGVLRKSIIVGELDTKS
jgi:hypothetical protein